MSKQRTEFFVGFVTVLGIGILIFAVFWGKNLEREDEYRTLTFEFNTINNLVAGDNIYVRGVLVGKVTKIDLQRDNVIVEGIVKKQIPLFSDASALIVNKELMGGRMVILYSGKSKTPHLTQNAIKGLNSKGLTESLVEAISMLNNFKNVSVSIDSLVKNLNNILPKKNLGKSIEDISVKFQNDLTEIKRKVIGSLNQLNSSLNSFDRATLHAIKGFENISPDLKESLESFSILVGEARKKVLLLSDTTNFMGKLFNSSSLYYDLQRTLNNIDSLTNQIKEDGIKAQVDLF